MSVDLITRYGGGVHLTVNLIDRAVSALAGVQQHYPHDTESQVFSRMIWWAVPVYSRLLNSELLSMSRTDGGGSHAFTIKKLRASNNILVLWWVILRRAWRKRSGTVYKGGSHRREFDISSGCMSAIEYIAEQTNMTRTDCINRLLQLGYFLDRERRAGWQVTARKPGQTETETVQLD